MNYESISYLIRAKGDSMEPEIYDGDTVLMADSKEISNGDICIVYYGGQFYIRRVFFHQNSITLHTLNTAYRDIVITSNDNVEFRILGKVLCAYQTQRL